MRAKVACLAMVWAAGLPACGSLLRTATRAGVAGSVDALSDRKTQEDVADIATSDAMQASTRALTASVTQGVVQGLRHELSGPELATAIGARTEAVMRQDVAPGVAAVVRETLDMSLRHAASDEAMARTHTVVAATTRAAVGGMTAGLAEGIRTDIAPALRDASARMPGMATALLADEGLRQAVGGMVRVVSREVILGSEVAIDTIDRKEDPQPDGSFFNGLLGPLATGWGALVALVAGLAITLVTLVVLVLKGNAQRRHLEQDSRRREEMLMAFIQSVGGPRGLPADPPGAGDVAVDAYDGRRRARVAG